MRVGLVVVHGVGETAPGHCLNAVLETLATSRPGYSVSAASEYTLIAETETDACTRQYPVIRRGAAHNSGIDIEAVEFNWADLSTAHPGRVNTLLSLFRVIFESHHLVEAMLDKSRDVTSWILRKLLWFASWLLRGPIAALTIATSAICGLFLFEPANLEASVLDVRMQVLAIEAALFVAALYLIYRVVRTHDYSWYDIVFSLAVVTPILLVMTYNGQLLPALDQVPDLKIGPQHAAGVSHVDCGAAALVAGCYVNGLYKVVIWGWRAWGVLLLFGTALLAAALGRSRKTGDRSRLATLSTSIAILIMQFLLWTTVVVSAIYPMLNRAETVTALKEARPIVEQAVARGEVARDGAVAKLVQVPDIELDWIARFKFIYGATALTVVLLITGVLMLMHVRRHRARTGLEDLEGTARRMPRLLFNPAIVAFLNFAFVVVFALVFIQPFIDTNQMFLSLRNLILPVAALVAVILPFTFGRRIANVVQFASDLIDHNYMPRIETAAYFIPSVFRARHRRPRRERIQARLGLVLQRFVRNQGYDGVIFLAHSQGSVIAYDYLRDNGPAYEALGNAAPALLTFGSPIGSIYQKYFHEYAASKPAPLGMSTHLKCWINLFRVDDYIGGRIAAPAGLRVDNHVMGLGGHTGYWWEPDVAEALDAILMGKVADATKPPPLPMDPASAGYAVHAMRGA